MQGPDKIYGNKATLFNLEDPTLHIL